LALGFEYGLIPLKVTFNTAEENVAFDELNVAGGMVSTVEDCISWNSALYVKIISTFLVELMVNKYISSAPIPIYDGLDNEDQKICYQHPGGCPGYQSRLIYLPVYDVTIVHLSNSQKDNMSYSSEKYKILAKNRCDDITAELFFNKQLTNHALKTE